MIDALGDTTAEVTEGGREFGGIWARERYDWSDPHSVVARVLDSNIFRPGSRWELRVRPTPAGGSRVEWALLRQPSSLKGRLVVLILRVAAAGTSVAICTRPCPSSNTRRRERTAWRRAQQR